jgi:hypothetical protein
LKVLAAADHLHLQELVDYLQTYLIEINFFFLLLICVLIKLINLFILYKRSQFTSLTFSDFTLRQEQKKIIKKSTDFTLEILAMGYNHETIPFFTSTASNMELR